MFNQSKVVPTVLSTTPKMYIYPTKSQKSPLFTFQPILWRHSRFFPYLAEIGLEPRVKRHMMNVLSPDRKQSKVYAAAASYKTHRYVCIYNCIYNYIYIYIHLAAILGSRLIFTPSTHWLKIVGFTTALIPGILKIFARLAPSR